MSARASAAAYVEVRASQYCAVPSATALNRDQLSAARVEVMDVSDSRWQRDPGRANGPFS